VLQPEDEGETESAGEILSEAPSGAKSKDLTPAPLARFICAPPLHCGASSLGVLAVGSNTSPQDRNIHFFAEKNWSGRADLNARVTS